jgi:protein-disulfide isomerase
MDSMSEIAVKAMPRRGRLWVIAVLAVGLFALGYFVVEIATQKPGRAVVHIAGINEAQEIFGGVPQEGDRLGSADAPVTIQVFNDLQCSSCRQDFLSTIPALVNAYARPGNVKLLYRHYSNSESPQELGFYGAEAAAQQGYGWQYTYLFFRNQDEAERFGIDQDFLDSVAGGIEELNEPEWLEYLEDNGSSDGAINQKLKGYDELGRGLGIRTGQAAIVSGPHGTQTLQDGPTLAEIEAAIEAVK